jgi:hypothetical protein
MDIFVSVFEESMIKAQGILDKAMAEYAEEEAKREELESKTNAAKL